MKKIDGIDIKKKTPPKKDLPKEPILKLPEDEDLEMQDSRWSLSRTQMRNGNDKSISVSSLGSAMRFESEARGSIKKDCRASFTMTTQKYENKKKKQKHLNIGDENFINVRNFLRLFIFILICAIFGILTSQILKTRTELLSLQTSLTKSLSLIETYAGDGNVEKSLNELSQMQTNLKRSKLIAQSWGQDFSYFQYVPGQKSALTEKEFLLDSGYDVVAFSDELKKNIGSLNLKSSDSCMLNLNGLSKQLSKLVKKMSRKATKYSRLSKGIDNDQTKKIAYNLNLLSNTADSINQFLKDDLPWLSGTDGKEKNILIVFQNNGELRGASGGSLGSFGIAKFKDGCLQKIDFGQNIYKLDHAFEAKTNVDPPEEIAYVNSNWTLKDSGWSIDGTTALSTIADFYKKETGSSVSGVVALDATFFENLLGEIGSINLPTYNMTITKDNFRSEIDQEVHEDYFKNSSNLVENEPKKVLGDMMPIAINKIFATLKNSDKATGLLSTINDSLSQKHIVMYFADKDFEGQIEQNNWAGKINSSLGDYLYVNNSNINGGKTSVDIDEKLNLDVTIDGNGNVTDKLNLVRNYSKTTDNSGANNINFVRMAIPSKSKITNFNPLVGNFQLYWDKGYKNNSLYWTTDDSGKTVANFWMSTKPDETSEAQIAYTPNYKIKIGSEFSYQILLQKQPGALDDTVILTLHYPDGYKPTNVKNYDSKNNTLKIKVTLSEDQNIKINFKKANN